MPEPATVWKRFLEERRKQKDEYFRTDMDSPIPEGERKTFPGLNYYPIEEKLRFAVRLAPVDPPTPLSFGVSQGPPRPMLKVGYFDFVVDGAPQRLWAYRSADPHGGGSLFVPFRDATSGKETYGAGRYLDLEATEEGTYTLDFNEAYNPYCIYSDCYSCPLPPMENWLKVPLRAGEKTYP
ncbi:MAG: DUF1684 domain-containing protein [Candidatus Thermoplasmatota archaeon]|jgi:uncharacterized protein (DUF1684 family)|nr:DUF1684 domain-containing protein [Candidatus Thermoplasmatota archaeon]